jgi:hypothetical protein
MQGNHVAAGHQGIERNQLRPEHAGVVVAKVGVVQQDLKVERLQEFGHGAADPGGANESDGLAVVARRRKLTFPVYPVAPRPVHPHGVEGLLVGEQNHHQAVFGHGDAVGFSGVRRRDDPARG